MLNINQLTITNKNETLVDINFSVKKSTALVGQSGSGKSLTLKSILQLLPSNLHAIFQFEADFELVPNTIGFIPQNPFTSLSPLTKIKDQFFCDISKAKKMLKLVNLEESYLEKFPSQLSGGQLQRIVIAIVLTKQPKILLLDEPTTALDKETQNTILDLIKSLQEKLDFLILFVTHDIASIENICEEIVILKDGKICESGLVNDILEKSDHPYTQSLIQSSFSNREFRK